MEGVAIVTFKQTRSCYPLKKMKTSKISILVRNDRNRTENSLEVASIVWGKGRHLVCREMYNVSGLFLLCLTRNSAHQCEWRGEGEGTREDKKGWGATTKSYLALIWNQSQMVVPSRLITGDFVFFLQRNFRLSSSSSYNSTSTSTPLSQKLCCAGAGWISPRAIITSRDVHTRRRVAGGIR